MVFDFVFTKKELSKKQFFQWLIDTMIENGWQNLSTNKTNVDFYSMYSTGESGDDKIGVQIRPFYNRASYDFPTTTYGLISARAFHSYTPSPSASSAGAFLPNGEYTDIRLLANELTIDDVMIVHYHINKDRVILVTESNDLAPTVSASFVVLGKPYTIAESDEYCKSAVITSQGTYACRSGVFGNNTKNLHFESTFRFNLLSKGKVGDKQFASEIFLSNDLDGNKFVVENIFATNFDNSRNRNLTVDMRKNTFKDSEGRVYKLCVNNSTSNLISSSLRSFLIRIG